MSARDWITGCAGALLMLAVVALGQWLDRSAMTVLVARERTEAFRAGVGEGMQRVGCWAGFRVDSATGLPLERRAVPLQHPLRESGK